jgi:glycosyltransferase involved in cell wall biosynthesis
MPGSILFVGHDAYRAGAEIALLHILTCLRAQRQDALRVLLGGELRAEYERLAPTYRLNEPAVRHGLLRRVLRRPRVIPSPSACPIPRALRDEHIDLVYLNTVAVAHLAEEVKIRWHVPVLLHVRELEMSIRAHCGSERFRAALTHVDGCVVGTRVVEQLLVERYRVPRERIHRVSPGLALPTRDDTWSPEGRAVLRAELGVPPDAFVVGACGSLNWWKAPELFILTAHMLRRRRPDARVHFMWVGGHPHSAECQRLQHDVDRLGLNAVVSFVGAQVQPHRHFALFDSFLLTSREDSFPFVCVEAAALGLPIVCFEGGGGAPELVEHDAGFVVPYLDVGAAADHLALLMDEPALRVRLGLQAERKVRAQHTLENMAHGLEPVLDRYMGLRQGSRRAMQSG